MTSSQTFSPPVPKNEAERLATLYGYSILDTDSEQVFEEIVALARHICGVPIALVSLVDKERQWFKAESGLGTDTTGRRESFCACALESPDPLIVPDALQDVRFSENPLVLGDPNIRFYAGAPLVAPNGHVLGTLCVIDIEPRTLTPEQLTALQALSRHVMFLIETRKRLADYQIAVEALVQTEKLAAVGRLASSMAHQINNPLASLTNLIFLSRRNAQNPDVINWLDQADLELRRISIVAGQALRFHLQTIDAQWVDSAGLFAVTLAGYEGRLRNAGITVEERRYDNLSIRCYIGDIRQVMSNIITNAIDAMPTGGRLLLRSRSVTDWKTGRKGLRLTLADTGVGMTPEVLSHTFNAFYTTKGISGSGLGLWMSREILLRHQGVISLRSSTRQGHSGTVVSIFIPPETIL